MERKTTHLQLGLLVVVMFIAMVVVNALSAMLPINGITPAGVSDSYPNLFAPAGITFSIWSIIYVLLAAYTFYQLGLFRGKNDTLSEGASQKIALTFAFSSLINIAWIFSWHYRVIPLSLLLMTVLLLSLIYIAFVLDKEKLSASEKILVRLPFTLYFGWITVATIANATALFVSLGWNGFGIAESIWTIVILLVGAVIGSATLMRFRNISYGIVLIWAYVGILIKHTSTDGFASQYPLVITTLYACIVLFIMVIGFVVFARQDKRITS